MKTKPKQYQDSIEGTVENHAKDIKEGREADFEQLIAAYRNATTTVDVMEAKKTLDAKYKGMYTAGEKRLLQSLDFNLKLYTGNVKAHKSITGIDMAWGDESDKGWDDVEATLEQRTEEPILLTERKAIPLTKRKIPVLGPEYLVQGPQKLLTAGNQPKQLVAKTENYNPKKAIRLSASNSTDGKIAIPLGDGIPVLSKQYLVKKGEAADDIKFERLWRATELPKEQRPLPPQRVELRTVLNTFNETGRRCDLMDRVAYRQTQEIPEIKEEDLNPKNFKPGFFKSLWKSLFE